MKWNTRRIAAAVIVLPAVLGVAACGKSESPAPAAGQTQASSAAATRWASYCHGRSRAAYAARWSNGDSEWLIGSPSTAQRVIRGQHSSEVVQYSRYSASFWLCSSSVSANFVSPVARLTVTKYR